MLSVNESRRRSLLKAVTYRGCNILLDSAVLYALTRRVELTAGAVILTNFSSTILYFFNERVWNRIGWGRVHHRT